MMRIIGAALKALWYVLRVLTGHRSSVQPNTAVQSVRSSRTQAYPPRCGAPCPACGAGCEIHASYAHNEHTHCTESGAPFWGVVHLWTS